MHLAVALTDRLAAADIELAVAVKDFRLIRHALSERSIGHHRLDRRARRIHAIEHAVEKCTVRLLAQAVPVRFDARGVIRWTAHHREHGARRRVEHDGRAAPSRKRIIGGLLDIGVDCQMDVIATVGLQEFRHGPEAVHFLRAAEQVLIRPPFDARTADALADVARNGRKRRAHWVRAFTGRRALRECAPFRIENRTALDFGLGLRTALVQRMMRELFRAECLKVRDVEPEHQEQREQATRDMQHKTLCRAFLFMGCLLHHAAASFRERTASRPSRMKPETIELPP